MIDPDLCRAIGTVLLECEGHTKPSARTLSVWVKPYVRTPATVSDVQKHLQHLEGRGDIVRHADPDNPALLSYSLTAGGKSRFSD